MTNDEFVDEVSSLGFDDVSVGSIFRRKNPMAVIRYTNNHELELCFYGLSVKGNDLMFVFNREYKSKLVKQVKLILDKYNSESVE